MGERALLSLYPALLRKGRGGGTTTGGTIYVPEDDYNKLRAKLLLKGVYSASKWVRDLIKKFLEET
jgi:hypothetical protein